MLILSAYILNETVVESLVEQQDTLMHAVLVNENLKFNLKGFQLCLPGSLCSYIFLLICDCKLL